MNRKNQQELINKYPNLFINVDKSPTESLMCFGLECGEGWFNLIDETCSEIQKTLNGRKLKFTQIKEKYGGLRIYTNYYIEDIDNILDEAEDKSFEICEECGSKENVKITETGWIYTRCETCMKKLKEKGLI